MMAVAVETDPAFRLGPPKILFRSIYAGLGGISGIPWDISPDGKRFLMMRESLPLVPAEGGPRKINIVLNWFEELKQRVPVK